MSEDEDIKELKTGCLIFSLFMVSFVLCALGLKYPEFGAVLILIGIIIVFLIVLAGITFAIYRFLTRKKRKEEERAKKEAEELAKNKKEKAEREALEKRKRETEEAKEKAKRESEEKTRKEAEQKVRREAEARAWQYAAEKSRREAEEKKKQEDKEQARREAEEKARKEIEDRHRREEKLLILQTKYLEESEMNPGVVWHQYSQNFHAQEKSKFHNDIKTFVSEHGHEIEKEFNRYSLSDYDLSNYRELFIRFWNKYQLEVLIIHDERMQAKEKEYREKQRVKDIIDEANKRKEEKKKEEEEKRRKEEEERKKREEEENRKREEVEREKKEKERVEKEAWDEELKKHVDEILLIKDKQDEQGNERSLANEEYGFLMARVWRVISKGDESPLFISDPVFSKEISRQVHNTEDLQAFLSFPKEVIEEVNRFRVGRTKYPVMPFGNGGEIKPKDHVHATVLKYAAIEEEYSLFRKGLLDSQIQSAFEAGFDINLITEPSFQQYCELRADIFPALSKEIDKKEGAGL